VGRFVPENNFETMIREFMASKSRKDLAIITTANDRFLAKLEKKLHFKQDPRIKFVGTVYDQDLLRKIRENAYAYLHGHLVDGTNPSLLESLSSTKLNLLLRRCLQPGGGQTGWPLLEQGAGKFAAVNREG
jgi:rhamnosyltransferase